MSNNLAVYSLHMVPVSYVGEIVSNTENELILQWVLLVVGGGKYYKATIGNVPYASRDSKITINKQAAPGALIEDVDHELKKHYDTEIISSYSSLKVVL